MVLVEVMSYLTPLSAQVLDIYIYIYMRERVDGCKRLHQNCLHPSTDVNDFTCDVIFYMMIKRHYYLRERVEGCKRLHQNRLHPSTDVKDFSCDVIFYMMIKRHSYLRERVE